MNESSETKKEINNILKKMQLPIGIKKITNNAYKEYEDAFKKLLLEIEQENVLEFKELQNLENYIKSDYKEDMQMTELVEFEEYEQKRTYIVELMGRILNSINSKEKTRIVQTVEEPTEKENKKSVDIIINTTVSEIQSSAKNILKKVPQKSEDLKQAVIEFEEEIRRIIEETKQSTPEISEILNNHFHEICEELSEIIKNYNKEFEPKKEEMDIAHRREEFIKRISNFEQTKNVEMNEAKQSEKVEELEH